MRTTDTYNGLFKVLLLLCPMLTLAQLLHLLPTKRPTIGK